MAQIDFTPEKHKQFRKEYSKAIKDGRNQFSFDGQELDTRYAGYLLEYLDMKLKTKH